MAYEIVRKKFCSQPFLTSTPIKSSVIGKKVKNIQSVELIKPSELLNALLNRDDQSNRVESKARTTKRGWSYFDDESSSSTSDEEEKFSERAKNAGLKINTANFKRCVDIKEDENDSSKVVRKGKGRNKSTMSEGSCKKPEKKGSLIPLRKNVSSNCQNSFKVSLKKAKVPSKSADVSVNSYQFENSQDSVNISLKANDKSKKLRTKNKIVDDHKSLETYFVPIKNKTKKKNAQNTVENKAKNGSSSETLNRNQISSLHHTEPELGCGEKVEVLFGCNDVKNDMHILSPIKTGKNIKEENKTKSRVGNDIIPAKKMKVRNKLSKVEDPGNSDKKNASYQLFSDSKQQELLNSLDLTKDDISDKENHLNSVKDNFSLLKQSLQPEIKPVSQEEKPVLQLMQEVKSSQQTQENENNEIKKENCLKDRQAITVNSTNGDNKEKALEEEKPCAREESKAIDESVNFRDCKGRLRKGSVFNSEAVVKKSILKNPSLNARKTSDEKINTGVLCDDQIKNCEAVIHRNDETTASSNEQKSKECNSHNSNNNNNNNNKLNRLPICGTSGVFRPFDDLSNLQEFKPGCSVAECWNLKYFKCGMLQLKPGSSHTSKTSNENSCFGGVVIKGKMKMKIGEKEIDLKEGDMNFVPPLTVWSVSNVEGMDAMMYYWCGRFRV